MGKGTSPLSLKGHSPMKSGLPPPGIAKKAAPPATKAQGKGKGWGLPATGPLGKVK